MNDKSKRILKKALLLCVGGVMLLNSILLAFTSNMNAGLIFTFAMGMAFVAFGALPQASAEQIPKSIKVLFFGGIAMLVAFATFLLGFGLNDNISDKEDALIVLGSGIRGEQLTQGLKNRLDTAIDCYEKNDDLIIVVSGGQGPQEDITEALAMERYLLGCGVPQSQIIKEEKATSTYENFVYSKRLLDEKLDTDYSVAFVSNEYHIYRAASLAETVGFEKTTHAHSSTMFYTVLPSCFRECMAVVKMWLFGR